MPGDDLNIPANIPDNLTLSGKEQVKLGELLAAAFDFVGLEKLFLEAFDKNLATEVPDGAGQTVTFKMLTTTQEWGQTGVLLRTALELSPNPKLHTFARALRAKQDSADAWAWKDLRDKTRMITGPFNQDLDNLYVEREVEHTLDEFLVSNEIGFILTGDLGTGKTMMLRHWAAHLVNKEHAVLCYYSSQLPSTAIADQLAQDLGAGTADSLFARLDEVQKTAATRHFVVIFDAIDQFDMQANAGPKDLLYAIDQFIRQIDERKLATVRVVLSCTRTPWNRWKKMGNLQFQLSWRNYYPEGVNDVSITLGVYNAVEQKTAYNNYKAHYAGLPEYNDLAQNLRDRLDSPLIMRLMVDSYKNQPWIWTSEDLPLNIYRTYYTSQIPPDAGVQAAINLVVTQMRNRQSSTLSVDRWKYDNKDNLDGKLSWWDDDESSPFNQLINIGMLTKEPNGDDQRVYFSEQWMGAYALALSLQATWQQPGVSLPQKMQDISDLVQHADGFTLAWDAARILLTVSPNSELFISLATAATASTRSGIPLDLGISLRELAVESLVSLYLEDSAMAATVIQTLLMHSTEDAQQVALKAMYQIGANAHDLYLWAIMAEAGSAPQLRRILHNTLYLIWREDQHFIYYLLDDLIKKVQPEEVLTPATQHLIEFVLQLAAVIYMNNPQVPEVQKRIAGLYQNLAVTQLHLDTVPTATANTVFWQTLGRFLIAPTLTTLLLEDAQPDQDVFSLPVEARAPLKTVVAPLLNPDSVLDAAALEQLKPLLNSEMLLFNILAAHVIPIHAARQPIALIDPIIALFDQLESRGRMAVLFSFSLLIPETPDEWIPMLELFTRRLVEEKNTNVFYGDAVEMLNRFDTLLLPLGLAYSKAGEDMLYFHEGLRNQLQAGDWPKLSRYLKGLAALGVYAPEAVFGLLERRIKKSGHTFAELQIQNQMLPLLAMLHILHFDAVDDFLQRVGLDTNYARRVRVAAGLGQLPQFIDIVALYNQIVYHAIHYPRLRDELSVKVLQTLADAPDEATFRDQCSSFIQDLFKSVNYDMRDLFK